MSGCGHRSRSGCPVRHIVHPWVIFNPPGLPTIAYRVWRLRRLPRCAAAGLPGETELTQTQRPDHQIWRPGAQGDLAVQMMEWWAYLGDILTFYNERIATQAYLGIADLPESVNRLIRLLGYRPRPGIGATGMLAALLNTTQAGHLAAGIPGAEQAGARAAAADFRAKRRPPWCRSRTWFRRGRCRRHRRCCRPTARRSGSPARWRGSSSATDCCWSIAMRSPAPLSRLGWPACNRCSRRATPTAIRLPRSPSPLRSRIFRRRAGDGVCIAAQRAAGAAMELKRMATSVISTSGIDLASIARDLSPGSLVLLEVTGNASVVTTLVTVRGLQRSRVVRQWRRPHRAGRSQPADPDPDPAHPYRFLRIAERGVERQCAAGHRALWLEQCRAVGSAAVGGAGRIRRRPGDADRDRSVPDRGRPADIAAGRARQWRLGGWDRRDRRRGGCHDEAR